MKKQTIAIDIDDVIADSTEHLRQIVNTRTGAKLTSKHYQVPHSSYWGYYERVWQTHGVDITYGQLDKDMETNQAEVPLLAGAAFALGELSKKFNLAVITARPAAWEAQTIAWLKAKTGDIFSSIHFAGSSKAEKTKGQICKEIGADWLIDDNPVHCQSAINAGINTILFGEYGWHHKAPKHLIRCKDWPAVVEFFDAR